MLPRIRLLMRDGETNKAFCKRIGIGVTLMSKWDAGSNISIESLLKISKATTTSLDWLVFGRTHDKDTEVLMRRFSQELQRTLEKARKAAGEDQPRHSSR